MSQWNRDTDTTYDRGFTVNDMTVSFTGPKSPDLPDFPTIKKNAFRHRVAKLGFTDIASATDEQIREAMDNTNYVYPKFAQRERDKDTNPITYRWAAAFVAENPAFGIQVGTVPRKSSLFAEQGFSL